MRALSPALAAHLAGETTTLCRCWRLTRRDGVVLGFTDHDRTLAFDATSFGAASGFEASEAAAALGLAIGGSEIAGALTSAALSEADIRAGRLDGAKVETFLVNWTDPAQHALLSVDTIGEITRKDGAFAAELRGPAAAYDQEKGRIYQRGCSAALGDARCAVNLSAPDRRATVAVMAATDRQGIEVASILSFATGALRYGKARFLSGAAAGMTADIVAHKRRSGIEDLRFLLALEVEVVAGDQVELTIGCSKTFDDCRTRFTNALNFRGFPHIPSADHVFSYAERGRGRNDGESLFR